MSFANSWSSNYAARTSRPINDRGREFSQGGPVLDWIKHVVIRRACRLKDWFFFLSRLFRAILLFFLKTNLILWSLRAAECSQRSSLLLFALTRRAHRAIFLFHFTIVKHLIVVVLVIRRHAPSATGLAQDPLRIRDAACFTLMDLLLSEGRSSRSMLTPLRCILLLISLTHCNMRQSL